ncbi:SPOR domain-containing protein [Novosphingobium flavum]|uniref:SPOR domain-containing protein n=1 Tax=Novosphingobium flavum TaxID=1778672 RepID=A0A7X1FRF3_9SPHN|nr:SPOR domain-containing protein [Novosphingobium flavum]MBC2665599.1 SPOR domain-containing protein [Novosphingobium flavum]
MHQGNLPGDEAQRVAEDAFDAAPQPALALDEDERLPWLESADDDDEDGGIDSGKLIRFALFGVVLLGLVGGALWVFKLRAPAGDVVAEGGVIKSPGPYKTVPQDQGGKTYAGTGDSAYVVSEGKSPAPKLGDGTAPVPVPGPSLNAGANAGTAVAAPAEPAGIGVQVGAYSSLATAEAGWQRLSGNNAALKGVKHRVVEGSADIGTVYRLQAVAGDLAAANALCASLKASGIACQVKR